MPRDKRWNHTLVKAVEALALLPRGPNGGIDWGDVWVGHMDTGFSRHPVFSWDGGSSETILADRGVNYMELGQPPYDRQGYKGQPGHGTRTASVLAGDLPGSFVGIAPGVPTVPYRVTDTVVLTEREVRTNLANAIRHAIDFNGCDVISISLGTPLLPWFSSRPLGEAVDYAYDRGVIVVAAAGQVIDRVTYPGKFFRSIGVGGVSENRQVWHRYDRGELQFIDVWAPSDDVYRANTVVSGGDEAHDFGYGDGTSYGTAHVAAAAAMWLVHRRQEIAQYYAEPWKRIEGFRRLIKATHRPVEGSYKTHDGTGILDVHALLTADLPNLEDGDYDSREAADMFG